MTAETPKPPAAPSADALIGWLEQEQAQLKAALQQSHAAAVPGQRKPRKRSTKPIKKPAQSEAMKRRWQDPEFRARMLPQFKARMAAARERDAEDRRLNPHKYSRLGVPDGMRKAEAMAAWAEAERKADMFIQQLKAEGRL